MRIESQTANRMVVVSRPWVLAVGAAVATSTPVVMAIFDPDAGGPGMRLFLVALGVAFSLVIWRYMPFVTLILDKPSGKVTLIRHRVTGNTIRILPLASIEGAMYQSNWSDGTRLERLALRGKEGPIPVEFGYWSGARSHVADAINNWLADVSA